MKKIIRITVLFLLSLTLISCDLFLDNQDISNDDKIVSEVVFNEEVDDKKEYIIYFTDGSSQIIYVTDDTLPKLDKITINDLYEAALNDGFTGSINEYISGFIDGEIDNINGAVNKGLRSSVSIVSTFVKTEIDYSITGFPQYNKFEYMSAGSGIIYKLDKETGTAYIITNHHVVYDIESSSKNKISQDIGIYLYGLEMSDYKVEATYIGGSELNDIAVLKVENSEILKHSIAKAVTWVNSDLINPGDTAIAIGNAQGKGLSATKGLISVQSEHITMISEELGPISFRVIRTDTPVNRGNSGGGLFNKYGEVIGIINAKVIADNIDGIGYAIPSNVAFNLADNIIYYTNNKAQEKGEKVLMGVTMRIVSKTVSYDDVFDVINLVDVIKVEEITPNSLASNYFMLDDELVSLVYEGNTYEITKLHQVSDILFKVRRNEVVIFKVIRDGELIDLEIKFLNEHFNEIP